MHFHHRACLGILLFLIAFSIVGKETAWGLTSQVDNARSNLVQTFAIVQQAEEKGVPQDQISLLVTDLNLALAYEENATQLSSTNVTSSNRFAEKSSSISNQTAIQALNLETVAQKQSSLLQISAYSIATLAAFGSALLVVEIHRLKNLARRIRLSRMRIE